MKRDQAIIHLLTVCESAKAFVHWQMSARIALVSLFIDKRITKEVRDEISTLISDGKLYDYDYLLRG